MCKYNINKLPRGAAGASYGNPVHLLDAANYIKHAWDAVSSTTISKNAEIVETLQNEEDNLDVDELNNILASLMQVLSFMNVNVTEDEMNSFLNGDKENNLEIAEAAMEEVNNLLSSQAVENEKNKSDSNDTTEAAWIDERKVTLFGLKDLCDKIALETQLLCKQLENEAGEQYDNIMSSI